MKTENIGMKTGSYWRKRQHLMYYKYYRYMINCIGRDAQSIVDVGSGNSPYLEWFDWIPEKVSVDIERPYTSDNVRGIEGSIFDLQLEKPFDVCTCMQVLEHIPEPVPFAQRLLEMGKLVLISVPYKWPRGAVRSHVNDPVDLHSVTAWFGRKPNYHLLVREPFKPKVGARLFAIFDPADPVRKFGNEIRRNVAV